MTEPNRRDTFTEQEFELLSVSKELIWRRLGDLIAIHTASFPEDIEHMVLAAFQDVCDVYSTPYAKSLRRYRGK